MSHDPLISIEMSNLAPVNAAADEPIVTEKTPLHEITDDTDDYGTEDEGTADEKDETPPTPCFVFVLAFFAAIGGFLFGYDTGVVSGALLLLSDYYALSNLNQEFVVSVTILAAAVGAAIAGTLSEWIGRRATLIGASLVFTIGAVLMAISPHQTWIVLFVGRLVVGIGIGFASMTVPVYIAECAPIHLRGKLIVVNNLFITGGQAVAAAVDGAFSGMREIGWRYMLGLAGVPAVIMGIGFLFMPESPRWLVRKGKLIQAKRVLIKIRGTACVDKELASIESNHQKEIQDEKKGGGGGGFNKLKRAFTTPSVRRAIIVGAGLQAIQQLSGINTVMYYTATIVSMAGVEDERQAIWWSVVVAVGNLLFTVIGFFLVERIGRRKLLLGSLLGVLLSLGFLSAAFFVTSAESPHSFDASTNATCSYSTCNRCIMDDDCGFCYVQNASTPLGNCQKADNRSYSVTTRGSLKCTVALPRLPSNATTHWAYNYCPSKNAWLVVVALICYIAFFAPGMGPMPWTINSEIYPNWARSVGVAVSTATNWSCNLLISLSFLSLSNFPPVGRGGAFLIYAGFAFIGFLFLYALLPETKGRKLEEMEKLFEKPWC